MSSLPLRPTLAIDVCTVYSSPPGPMRMMAEVGNVEEDPNVALQKEELEALSAIYGDDFLLEQDYDGEVWLCLEDKDFLPQNKAEGVPVRMPTFSIAIRPSEQEQEYDVVKKDISKGSEEARLIISFQPGYPTCSPPIYQLSIPWLRGGQKQVVAQALEELYLENLGESIVYIWVEKLRELLQEDLLSRKCSTVRDEEESKSRENRKKLDPSGGNNSAVPVTHDGRVLVDSTSGETEKLIEHFTTSLSFNHSFHDNGDDGKKTRSDLYDREVEETTQSHQSKYNQIQGQDSFSPSNKMEIQTGVPLTDRKSTFQAHAAPVNEVRDVRYALNELYKNKKIAAATHNMYAYRILKSDGKTWIQDCDDDGETHAGSRLLHLLQILDCRNVLVVVSRWYGGIQLHGDRFKHINNVARQALVEFGFLSGTDGKKVEELKSKKTSSASSRK